MARCLFVRLHGGGVTLKQLIIKLKGRPFQAALSFCRRIMDITVRVDVERTIRRLTLLQREQIPFASALSTFRVAKKIIKAEKEEMRRKFDRPTPYTLNSLEINPKRPDKSKPSAQVWLKYFAGKGTPAEKYLLPEIDGGSRNLKRFEKALIAARVMPAGCFAVPGKSAKKDAYGNMSRGQIVQILSYFRAFPEMGYLANMSDRRRESLARGTQGRRGRASQRGFVYVAIRERQGHRAPGIYQRMAGKKNWKCVLKFVQPPSYRQKLDYYGVAQRVVDDNLSREFGRALAQALRTAR